MSMTILFLPDTTSISTPIIHRKACSVLIHRRDTHNVLGNSWRLTMITKHILSIKSADYQLIFSLSNYR